jgi:hypothetical protein
MAAVGLGDGSVECLVVHVIDASAVEPTRVRGRESSRDQLREKVARLLPVDDAGEGGVLPEQTNARVLHHEHEEPRLALGESELCDGGNTFGLSYSSSSARCGSKGRPRLPVRAIAPR